MKLRENGLDIFYIDESEKTPLFVVTAVRVPFLRVVEGEWRFVWGDYLDKAVDWRRALSAKHSIRYRAELHAAEILTHHGVFKKSWENLAPLEATALCKDALKTVDFLAPESIITTFATDQSELFGEKRTNAAMLGLFQRIRRHCGDHTNGMMIFDGGHPEYVNLYRKATKWLPTGSMLGGWSSGEATDNLALDMFPKDANLKASDQSLFLQIADMVCYCARLKLEHERGLLQEKRVKRGHSGIYDSLDRGTINRRATKRRKDGLVPI